MVPPAGYSLLTRVRWPNTTVGVLLLATSPLAGYRLLTRARCPDPTATACEFTLLLPFPPGLPVANLES